MSISPAIELSPLEIRSTRIVEANSYESGDLIVVSASPTILADNRDETKMAEGIVVSASSDSFQVVTSAGQVVPLPSHGLGSAGDRLWLGETGDFLTSAPSSVVVQVAAKVVDSDSVLLFPPSLPLSSGATPAERVRAYLTSDYVLGNPTWTASPETLIWTGLSYDTDSMYSVSNPTRITFTTAGFYQISVAWVLSSGSGTLTCRIKENGSSVLAETKPTAPAPGFILLNNEFSATDYIEIEFQATAFTDSDTLNSDFTYIQAVRLQD